MRPLILAVCLALSAPTPAPAQQELRSGALVFRYWPGSERLAEALAARAGTPPLPALPDVLGDSAIVILLAPDEVRFDSLTGGRAPDWGAGVAFPETGVIVLPAYTSRRGGPLELHGVLRHELAHVALQRWLQGARPPIWFTEGYATWAAGQLDESAAWLLRLAFVTGRAPPLDSLALEWPAQTNDAHVAYLLAASAVEYLYRNGGDRVMRIFLQRWRDTRSFDRALYDVYGLQPARLEEYWSRDVRRRYGWLRFFSETVVVWTLLALLVLVLWLIRRRRDRARLIRLRATEPPDQPAFWLETAEAPAAATPGAARSGAASSGEGQSGEGQSGEGQSGEGQSGEGQSGATLRGESPDPSKTAPDGEADGRGRADDVPTG